MFVFNQNVFFLSNWESEQNIWYPIFIVRQKPEIRRTFVSHMLGIH